MSIYFIFIVNYDFIIIFAIVARYFLTILKTKIYKTYF